MTAIANHPTKSSVAYLGSANGGVWKTTDSGSHWTPVFDKAPSQAIGAIAINPSRATTVFVGTGEPNDPGSAGADVYFGAGVFKSLDGGKSWKKIGGSRFNYCYVAAIAVAGGAPATLYVATGNKGRYSTTCDSGLYRSRDGGTTWSKRLDGSISDVMLKPATSLTVYAAKHGRGIWRSTDGGSSFRRMRDGLPSSNLGRIRLAVSEDRASRVYAAIGRQDNWKAMGVWTSTTSGRSWSRLPYHDFCAYSDGDATGQCEYDLAVTAYPGDDRYVYAAGIRLQRWNGSRWKTLGYNGTDETGIHVDFHALAFDAANRLWVGSDGGAYYKAGGTHDLSGFVNLNRTLGITQFYPGISGSTSGPLLGGTQDNGTLQYTPGAGWYEFEVGDGGYTAYDPVASASYSTYVNGLLQRDAPGAYSCWLFGSYQTSGCTRIATEPTLFLPPVVRSPSDTDGLFLGTNRIWRTANGGSTWSCLSGQVDGYLVTSVAQSASVPDVVYGAWSVEGTNHVGLNFVAVTQNATAACGNVTWEATEALPNRYITDLHVKSSDPATAWVTLSGYGSGHVFVTQNYGTDWTDISSNLPDAPVNAIAVDSRTSPSTVYVATDVGVFWSVDAGASWANTSVGLPPTVVMDLMVDGATDRLVAATHGRGMYTAPLPAS